MAEITLEELLEPVTINMFGVSYQLRGVTRSRLARLAKVRPALERLEGGDLDDKSVEALAEFADLFLEPVDDAPPAKKLLADRWRNDELEAQELGALVGVLAEQIERRANPTSRAATGG